MPALNHFALNGNDAHTDGWWALFDALFKMARVACYDDGTCYGYSDGQFSNSSGVYDWDMSFYMQQSQD